MKTYISLATLWCVMFVTVLRADEPKEIAKLEHECRSCPISAIAFAPNGKLLASSTIGGLGLKNEVKLWDAVARKGSDVEIKDTKTPWNTLAFSPDSKRLAGAKMFGKSAYLWNVETGELDREFEHKGTVWCVRWSPDGKYLATADEFGFANVWDVDKKEKVAEFKITDDRVFSVAFSPDGNRLATGDRNGVVHLWDLKTKKALAKHKSSGMVRSLAFTADGKVLATGNGLVVKLWRGDNGKAIGELEELKEHIAVLAISKDGLLATGDGQGSARIWNLATQKEVASIKLPAIGNALDFSPDGKTLVVSNFNELHWFDVSPLAKAAGKPEK